MHRLQLSAFPHPGMPGDLGRGQHRPGRHAGGDQLSFPRGGGIGRQMRLQNILQHRLIAHPVIAFSETLIGLLFRQSAFRRGNLGYSSRRRINSESRQVLQHALTPGTQFGGRKLLEPGEETGGYTGAARMRGAGPFCRHFEAGVARRVYEQLKHGGFGRFRRSYQRIYIPQIRDEVVHFVDFR
jgi:hypothetical protein